jgi:hypothetical protein
LNNVASRGTGSGHAVYTRGGGFRYRDTTADKDVLLYVKRESGSVWTYTDPDPNGVGNTTDNWNK